MEERLNELETRIAFMDKTIEDLDDALAGQQKQLDKIEQKVDEIVKHFHVLMHTMTNADSNINNL